MKTTFSITSFFYPYGDGKSNRKVFQRKFYHSEFSDRDQIKNFFDTVINNRPTSYYGEKIIKFKSYIKTKPFII